MGKDFKYREFVQMLSKTEDKRVFLNSDEEHALDVLVELIQSSKETVRIFAGCLCKHVGNQEEYIMALSDFIERGGNVFILLNNFDQEAAKISNLYKRLAYYINDNKPIYIKSSEAHPFLVGDSDQKPVHFTIGDEKSYRIETDIEKRTAECSMNNPAKASSLAKFYDELFSRDDAKDIDISALFN